MILKLEVVQLLLELELLFTVLCNLLEEVVDLTLLLVQLCVDLHVVGLVFGAWMEGLSGGHLWLALKGLELVLMLGCVDCVLAANILGLVQCGVVVL